MHARPTAAAAARYRAVSAVAAAGGRLREGRGHGESREQDQDHEDALRHGEPPLDCRVNGVNASPVSVKNFEKNS